MWRNIAAHARAETEFLNDAIERIRLDRALRSRAEMIFDREAAHEPIIADASRTPQTPPHHAEGPFVADHMRLMLEVLAAVLEDKLHLIDIEEFARLKGFEGEVEEIEETIKENAALFETFVLCHDAAKWATVYFDAPAGSRGRAEGFFEDTFAHRHDIGISERAKFRARYLDLFASADPETFYDTYQIQVHYAGHDRLIRAKTYRALLERVAGRRRLMERDLELLETLIAHHLDPVADFRTPNPAAVLRYHALAAKHGFDADDFIDLLQGCVFLDTVCGSVPHDASSLVNFLRAEHDFAPWRREEKEREREEKRKRERNALFRNAGLDGVALMDVLGMEPGPKFGVALRRIHEAIVAGTPLPSFGKDKDKELARRVGMFYEKMFVKGE
jgi:hypothetical protein